VEVAVSIWSSGLVSRVQFLVALVMDMTQTGEELSGLPEPAYKYKDRKGDGYILQG
jgi:hypothetical protein